MVVSLSDGMGRNGRESASGNPRGDDGTGDTLVASLSGGDISGGESHRATHEFAKPFRQRKTPGGDPGGEENGFNPVEMVSIEHVEQGCFTVGGVGHDADPHHEPTRVGGAAPPIVRGEISLEDLAGSEPDG
jgi:hypothetical protein